MPAKNRKTKALDELRAEYDIPSLKGGVRGKYFTVATARDRKDPRNGTGSAAAISLSRVIEAKHDGRFRIRLVFEDSTAKTVDFRPWLNGPVFAPLKDVKYIQGFFLDGGTVAWPNGADIAPEALYAAEDVGSVASKGRRAGRAKPL